jgi:hypothetical protein
MEKKLPMHGKDKQYRTMKEKDKNTCETEDQVINKEYKKKFKNLASIFGKKA